MARTFNSDPHAPDPDDPDERLGFRNGGRVPHSAHPGDAERNAAIVAEAVRGERTSAIAKKFGLTPHHVARIMREAAEMVRDNMVDVTAHTFLMQLERLERLYQIVEREIQAYEADLTLWMAEKPDKDGRKRSRPTPEVNLIRAAIQMFERQAKLLGLDKGAGATGEGGWAGVLKDMPIERVVAYAAQLKMKEPEAFATPD